MKFCSHCGNRVTQRIPAGDDRLRFICERCGMIHYDNPKMVVGSIPTYKNRVLLCKRAIEPRAGLWTLPAGYLENGETVSQGAIREAMEEAQAAIEIIAPYGLYDLSFISQIYLIFRARLRDGDFSAGPESEAVDLFHEDDIPWGRIAFPVIEETLRRFCADRKENDFPFHVADIPRPSGTTWHNHNENPRSSMRGEIDGKNHLS